MPNAELVLIAGPLGGGKTTVVQDYVSKGYCRLNRDDLGDGCDELECPPCWQSSAEAADLHVVMQVQLFSHQRGVIHEVTVLD